MKLIVLLALVGVAVAIPNPFSPFGPQKTGSKTPDMIIPDFNKGKSLYTPKSSYSPKSYTPSYSPKSYSPKSYSPKSYTPSYSPKSYTPSYSPKSYSPKSYSPKGYSPYSPKGYTPGYKGKEMYAPKKFHEKEMLVPKIEKSADPVMIIPGVTKGKGIFIPQDPMKIKRDIKSSGDLVIPDICLENVPKVKDIVIPDAPKKVVPKVVPN